MDTDGLDQIQGVTLRLSKKNIRDNSKNGSHVEIFKKTWKTIENRINVLNGILLEMYFGKLMNKLKMDYDQYKWEYLPATILSTGFNHLDRFIYLDILKDNIRETVTPYVIFLNRMDCKTVKLCVESIVSKYLKIHGDTKELKKRQLNFDTLKKWYEKSKPLYSRKYQNRTLPLIIMFDDIGNINRTVLKDMIALLWSQMKRLPIMLIFVSFATFEICLNEVFYYESVLKLKINLVECPEPEEHFKEIVENIIISDLCPILLEKKSYDILRNSFHQFDFSITRFIHHFKYALFSHFAKGHVYTLCAKVDFNDFTDEDYEDIRKCYSIRSFVEGQDALMQIHFFNNDLCVSTATRGLLTQFSNRVTYFQTMLKCVHILVSDLPKNPMGQFGSLYINSIQNPLIDSEEYKTAKKFLLMSSLEFLLDRLEEIVLYLEPQMEVLGSNSNFKQFMVELSVCVNTFLSENEESIENLDLKKGLIIGIFDEYLPKFLAPLTRYPLHEIFFCESVKILSEQKRFSLQDSIHDDLINPKNYIQCSCCNLEKKSTPLHNLPDISLLYKLHFEYKDSINLDTLLQTFSFMVNSRKSSNVSEDDDCIQPEIRETFRKLVDFMVFLGLIKVTNRTNSAIRQTDKFLEK